MNFNNLHLFNIVLLGKLSWSSITQSERLVDRILKAHYFPRKDFINATLGTNSSQIWRGIFLVLRSDTERHMMKGKR